MADQTAFEARLADAYDRYVSAAPVAIDPRTVAAVAATGGALPLGGGRRAFRVGPRLVMLAAVGIVILSLAVGVAFVGSNVAPHPTAPPTAVPTVLPTGLSSAQGVLTPGPDMAISRLDPVVVAMADGRVLIAAGVDGTGGRSDVPAEVFDPSTGRSTKISLDAPTGIAGGQGVLLPDGRIFIIVHDGNLTVSRAYLFDPVSMRFHEVAPGNHSSAPVFGVNPTMALLQDGRVLIAGGLADIYSSNILATAQLFDPTTETFAPTGSMAVPRWRHSMTTLPDGRVLVAGGEGTADVPQPSGQPIPPDYRGDAEVYDPSTGRFTTTGAMLQVRGPTLAVPLPGIAHQVAVMPRLGWDTVTRTEIDGTLPPFDPSGPVPVEIYDPATGTFQANGTTPGLVDSAVLLHESRILLTGATGTPGYGAGLGVWSVVYDVQSGQFTKANAPRAWIAAAAALPGGRALFAGGGDPASGTGRYPLSGVPWIDIFK